MAQLRTRQGRERGLRLVRWLTSSGDEDLLRNHQLLETLACVPWPACPRRWPAEPVQTADALVRRLLEVYPLPPVLRAPFGKPHVGRHARQVFGRLSSHVGAGGSFAGAREQGLVPDTCTRRVYREFLRGSPHGGLLRAWRFAQATAVGAPRWAAVAVVEHTRWRHRARSLERFWEGDGYWFGVIDWFGRVLQDRAAAGPIVDFLSLHPIDLAGRTAASVQRRVEEWHQTLSHRPSQPSFADPPYDPVPLDEPLDAPGWTLQQVLRPVDLWLEGQELRHCVWSYRDRVRSGDCSIWSLRSDGERVLTLEVHSGRVVQIRGLRNRRPSASEEALVRSWAVVNGCCL